LEVGETLQFKRTSLGSGRSGLPFLGTSTSPLGRTPRAAPLPITARVGPPSLSILGVLALALAIAAILSALLVPVLPLRTTVILGQSLGILLVPLAHASLALRIAAVLPRAIPAELR
jgi:hypothetical protein